MKKHVFGRKFKRDTNERKALFKGLMNALVIHDRIKTTEEKAKAIRSLVEKCVTKAKIDSLHTRQLLSRYFASEQVKRLVEDIAPRFQERPGGYTRIVRLGKRFSDNASLVLLEWVVIPQPQKEDDKKPLLLEEKTEVKTDTKKEKKEKAPSKPKKKETKEAKEKKA